MIYDLQDKRKVSQRRKKDLERSVEPLHEHKEEEERDKNTKHLREVHIESAVVLRE